MNKNNSKIICAGAITALAISFLNNSLPLARLTVKVVNEDGTPIEGAEVRLTFHKAKLDSKNWGTGRDTEIHTAKTDQMGFTTLEGYSDGELGGGVHMSGYYRGWWRPYQFSSHNEERWQPWNPTVEVRLRRILNAIPMFEIGRAYV